MSEPIDTTQNFQVGNGDDATMPANLQVNSGVPAADAPYAKVGDKEFATAEDLQKWYDGERLQGASTEAGGESTAGTTGQDTQADTAGQDTLEGALSDDAIKANLQKAGGIYADPKYEPFALEFEKTGKLSEASVTAAAAAFGIPEDFVKEFVKGQEAMRANVTHTASQADVAFVAELTKVVPDAEAYAAILEWGKANLSKDQQAAYNKALDAKDATTASVLLGSFKAAFNAAGEGKGPRDVTVEGGPQGGSVSTQGFANREEMHAAQNDERYRMGPKQDRNFVREVERKIGLSSF